MHNYDDEDRIMVPRFEESAGFYTTGKRSKMMSKMKSKHSKPEVLLRRALWAKNIRFRIHDNTLAVHPDIVIKKYKLAIFVDGEFWHGFEWKKNEIKSNPTACFGFRRSNEICRKMSV